MRRIAVIPARGGSKRLPGKNIIDFLGRPIIAYSIEAARECGLFERVIVSTDDEDIARVSEQFGAETDRRPDELATDDAHLIDVCLDLFDREAEQGREYDQFCMVHATSPLRQASDIKAVVELLEEGRCLFACALSEFNHYAHQALKLDENGFIEPMWPEHVNQHSHLMPHLVGGSGSTYAAFIDAFRAQRTFFGKPMRGHLMDRLRSIDIDIEEDLEIVKLFKEYLDAKKTISGR